MDCKKYLITESTIEDMPKIPMTIDKDILSKYKFESVTRELIKERMN